jgi:hypothetical protein
VNTKCARCGGQLRRVHRTFVERFSFMAKYRCRVCQSVETAPRSYRNHFGTRCRCPRCGTYRITKLKVRDGIDKMETGLLNLIERWMGGNLYHCRFCRIQFFDRRTYSPNKPETAPTDERSTATLGG